MRAEIIEAIDSERLEQDRRFPNHHHTPGEYILILRKLMKDAERVWYPSHGDEAVMNEIRQIAAVCVKAMEEHGLPMRVPKGKTKKR